jgi:NAD(P)-dependent dehydrogenase (short-subunit alcohol dehydrogenase family)
MGYSFKQTEGNKLQDLKGKVALVTGGSSGIGRATALAFARAGAKVVVANRRSQAGEETVSMIRRSGGDATFVKTDVSQASEVEELVKAAVQTYGRLDCALNNAGTDEGFGPRLADISEQDFDYQLSVNLKGVWLCMKYELLQMLRQGAGVIVNMSSLNGVGGAANASLYSAAKHGVMGLTKSAALEYAPQNIRVNAICAGAFDTPMLDRVFERAAPGNPKQIEALYSSMVAMRRIGKPEEAAEAVVWLCSDASSYVTGASLVVDGGLSARLI